MSLADAVSLLLADARLPTAGHTQSGGLEPALADPRWHGSVPDYLRLRLRTVTRVEAATAVAAQAAFSAHEPPGPVIDAWAARTPSRALRDNARAMGKALARLGDKLWPLPVLPPDPPRAVVAGAVGVAAGLRPIQVARVVAYDDVQTVASAALKLQPCDPADATRWVLQALPLVEELAAATAPLRCPDQIPGASAPVIEQYAELHARATRRLFSA